MTVDSTVVPGLLLLAAELLALAAVGYVIARVALRQTDDLLALAQGLVIGPALWGLIVNFLLHVLPGLVGAVAGWAVVLACGAALAWRKPSALRLPPRTAVAFAGAAFTLFSVALASRQLVGTADEAIHFGLSASVRAGAWPLVLPWIPDQPVHYHYGADLLVGLLTTSVGPDIMIATEILGAYIWTGFALVLAMLLRKIGGLISLVTLAPLLLTSAAWSMVGYIAEPPDIVQIPVPMGVPTNGAFSFLISLYFPEASLQWQTKFEPQPPNISRSHFVFAYALAMVVLERAANRGRWRSWLSPVTLGSAIGFMGLLSEDIALVTLALWTGLEATRVLPLRRLLSARVTSIYLLFLRPLADLPQSRPRSKPSVPPEGDTVTSGWSYLGAAAGPVLSVLLLAASGGPISGLLSGTVVTGTTLGWIEDPASRRPFGTLLNLMPGGIGLLGLGFLPVVAIALLLAVRQRLVLALAAGGGVFMLAALTLQYKAYPLDMTRIDGHARTFALLALLIALSVRLGDLRLKLRYLTAAGIMALVVWPTVAAPIRTLSLQVNQGITLANPAESVPAEPIAQYIRDHTRLDARVLSPAPHDISASTGRPNASGLAGFLHLLPKTGPEYLDAIRHLDPSAVQRLGFSYVHATDTWTANLPDRSRRWLYDPLLFELLVRDGADSLYRIRPSFLRLEATPDPRSFEALRRATPAGAAVYLTESLNPLDSARLASVLAHTRLLGKVNPAGFHLLSEIPTESLGSSVPDIIIIPDGATSFFNASSPALQRIRSNPVLVWWSHGIAAYAANKPTAAAMGSLLESDSTTGFSVHLSDVQSRENTITFVATLTDSASDQWTGQDWLVVPVDDSPLALPTSIASDRHTFADSAQWYAGQIVPGQGTTSHIIRFSPRGASFAVRRTNGNFEAVKSSGASLEPGVWALTLRLRAGYLQAAAIPVLKIVVSDVGVVSYHPYASEVRAAVNPCPEQLTTTDACRQLFATG